MKILQATLAGLLWGAAPRLAMSQGVCMMLYQMAGKIVRLLLLGRRCIFGQCRICGRIFGVLTLLATHNRQQFGTFHSRRQHRTPQLPGHQRPIPHHVDLL